MAIHKATKAITLHPTILPFFSPVAATLPRHIPGKTINKKVEGRSRSVFLNPSTYILLSRT